MKRMLVTGGAGFIGSHFIRHVLNHGEDYQVINLDCLTYAGEQDPDLILDFATLTGSARVALGPDLPPVMARDNGLSTALAQAGHEVGDPLWPMPLYLPYAQHLRSTIADLCNITEGFGFAGSITAGLCVLDRMRADLGNIYLRFVLARY